MQRADEVRQRQLALERERRFGLMEYLFAHGAHGEQQKDSVIGRIPKDWVIKPLQELADIYSGGTPSKENEKWWRGVIPWVSTKDLKRPRLTDVRDHIT